MLIACALRGCCAHVVLGRIYSHDLQVSLPASSSAVHSSYNISLDINIGHPFFCKGELELLLGFQLDRHVRVEGSQALTKKARSLFHESSAESGICSLVFSEGRSFAGTVSVALALLWKLDW